MEIRNPSVLKQDAARALKTGREPGKVITAYAGISAALTALVFVVSYFLSRSLDGTGGLRNLGSYQILQTIQSCLPVVQILAGLVLELGYISAMMRISRRQYADHTDLKAGTGYLGPMIRLSAWIGLVMLGIAFGCYYVSYLIFLMTPWGSAMLKTVFAMSQSGIVLDGTAPIDEAVMVQLTQSTLPLMLIFLVIFGVAGIWLSYRYRMAVYCLLDNPRAGAMAAVRESRRLMRGNWRKLFRLDLSFWWYFAGVVLASCIGDAATVVEALGISLTIDPDVLYFLSLGGYLAVQFALEYFCRNRVECTYILAYDGIRTPPKDSGVVLGNIFQM